MKKIIIALLVAVSTVAFAGKYIALPSGTTTLSVAVDGFEVIGLDPQDNGDWNITCYVKTANRLDNSELVSTNGVARTRPTKKIYPIKVYSKVSKAEIATAMGIDVEQAGWETLFAATTYEQREAAAAGLSIQGIFALGVQ